MLLNAIPRNFDEEIDESNNPAYEQNYAEKYGGLNGWIKFDSPEATYVSMYKNGSFLGPGFEFNTDYLYEQFAHNDALFSRLGRGKYPFIYVRDDGGSNALEIQEKELRALGLNRESIVSLGFILGFTSRVSALMFQVGAQQAHAHLQSDAEDVAFCAGCAYPFRFLVDPDNPDWLGLQNSVNESIVKLTLDDEGFESLDDFGHVQDGSLYRLLFNIAALNWSREQGVDILEADNFESITGHIKNQFSRLAPIHGEETLIRELKELSEMSSQQILDLLLEGMEGKVHYENFQDAWCSGMLIGEAFISWDVRYTLWLWDHCLLNLFESRFIRVSSSLPNSKALDKVLSERNVMEVHRVFNPLWGLKDKSNLARCYSGSHEEHPGRFTIELELVIVCRLHDRAFHQSAIENHQLLMTGHQADSAANFLPEDASDFLENFVDTSIVNACIREGQTIQLLKTIALAASLEQDTQKFIKSEIDASYALSIQAFDYTSHFSKWEPQFSELDGKIASSDSTASRAIQNLDDTMSLLYSCIRDIVESQRQPA